MLEVIYFLLAVSNVLFGFLLSKQFDCLERKMSRGLYLGTAKVSGAVAGLLINFAALGILGYYISSTCPLRYVLIFTVWFM